MRNRLLSIAVAALLAPALVASGAAQSLFGCSPTAKMSCCKQETPSAPTVSRSTPRCCEVRAGTARPLEMVQAPAASAPVLVAVVQAALPVPAPLLDARGLPPPPDPLPQRTPLQTSCALLI